jgi:hypothetical protein
MSFFEAVGALEQARFVVRHSEALIVNTGACIPRSAGQRGWITALGGPSLPPMVDRKAWEQGEGARRAECRGAVVGAHRGIGNQARQTSRLAQHHLMSPV